MAWIEFRAQPSKNLVLITDRSTGLIRDQVPDPVIYLHARNRQDFYGVYPCFMLIDFYGVYLIGSRSYQACLDLLNALNPN